MQAEHNVDDAWIGKAAKYYIDKYNGKFALDNDIDYMFNQMTEHETGVYHRREVLFQICLAEDDLVEAFRNRKLSVCNIKRACVEVILENVGKIISANETHEWVEFPFCKYYNPYLPEDYFGVHSFVIKTANVVISESGVNIMSDSRAEWIRNKVNDYNKAVEAVKVAKEAAEKAKGHLAETMQYAEGFMNPGSNFNTVFGLYDDLEDLK